MNVSTMKAAGPDPRTRGSGALTGSQRRAARVAGYALLVMALLAFGGFFMAIERLVAPDDPAATVAGIAAAERLFRAGIAGLLGVVVLDVLVATAFYVLFEPVSRFVSLLTAAFRLVYAAIFGAALGNLLRVLRLVGGDAAQSLDTASVQGDVMLALAGFNDVWQLGLGVFGVHLVLLGALFFRSGYIPRLLSVLVSVAGLGYMIDSFAGILLAGYDFSLAMYTFIGEVLLIFWLLFGFRAEAGESVADVENAQPAPTP